MTELLTWLAELPTVLLYFAIAAAAFAENIFPPLPADSVVALGAFVASRSSSSPAGVWAATMVGNLGGAFLMFMMGRRLGADWLRRTLPRLGGPDAAERVRRAYVRYGVWALAASRFVPAVRAVVPPLAGALRVRAWPAMAAMSIASGLWYGVVTWLAFHLGANADVLLERVRTSQRAFAVIALTVVVLVVGVVIWRIRHRED